jgi:hypothetical protein
MESVWGATRENNLGEVERLLEQDPGLLDARDCGGWTPLMWASESGHTGLVRWLVDKGGAINERSDNGSTALWLACALGRLPVVSLLVEKGADSTIPHRGGRTPLIAASLGGHLEVVRLLLGHPSARITINHRDVAGRTALWCACHMGRGGMMRALLESGADLTICRNDGITPMAVARTLPDACNVSAEGRRECVTALQVRSICLACFDHPAQALWLAVADAWDVVLGMVAGGGAGLSALEGPAGGRCGRELRGACIEREDPMRGQASARGGSAGRAEGPCGPWGAGAAGRVRGGGEGRGGWEEDGGAVRPRRALAEARGVRRAHGADGLT